MHPPGLTVPLPVKKNGWGVYCSLFTVRQVNYACYAITVTSLLLEAAYGRRMDTDLFNTSWIQETLVQYELMFLFSFLGQRSLWEGGWGHRDGSHHFGWEDECLQDWPVGTQQGGTCWLLQRGKPTLILQVDICLQWKDVPQMIT